MKKIFNYLFLLFISFIFLTSKIYADENKVYWNTEIGSISYAYGLSLESFLINNKGANEETITNIESIVFNDVTRSGTEITEFDISYDISRNNDNSIIAGIKDNILYIQFSGTLYFNPISREVLAGEKIKTITGLEYINTSNVTDMKGMFRGSSRLEEIDLKYFDTSKVTNMSYMFYNCLRLTSLDLSNFNTSNVTNMQRMFSNMKNLRTINLNNLNTSNVTDMSYMFDNCIKLTEIDLSNIDMSNVEYTDRMFSNCTNSTTITLSNYKTSKLKSTSYMFYQCSNLKTINFNNLDTSNVTNMEGMFYECINLEELDLSSFNTSKVTNMKDMFCDSYRLKKINLSSFNTKNVTDMSRMFWACNALEYLDLSHFDTSSLEKVDEMFFSCTGLKYLNLGSFDLYYVTDMSKFLNGCKKLEVLVTPNTDQVISLPITLSDSEFNDYTEINNLPQGTILRKKHTIYLDNDGGNKTVLYSQAIGELPVVEKEGFHFEGWQKSDTGEEITSETIYNFNSDNIYLNAKFTGIMPSSFISGNEFNQILSSEIGNSEIYYFQRSEELNTEIQNIYTVSTPESRYPIYMWRDGIKVYYYTEEEHPKLNQESGYMFYNTSLMLIDLTSIDTSEVTDMNNMFASNSNLTDLDLSNFNTSNVTNMESMFENNQSMTILDLSSFDTSKVTKMSNMFINCNILHTIYVTDKFKTNNLTDGGYYMFYNDYNLVGYNGTTYDYSNYHLTMARIDSFSQSGYFSVKAGIKSDVYEIDDTNRVIYADGAQVNKSNIIADNVEVINGGNQIYVLYGDIVLRLYDVKNTSYTITWENYDGTILEENSFEYGTIPTYYGETPTKESTAEYSFIFSEWTPLITNVTANATYKANFTKTKNKYVVTFVNDDDTVISEKEYEYGTPSSEIIIPSNPTKESTEEYIYTFNKWDKDIEDVTDNIIYKATYNNKKRIYIESITLNVTELILNTGRTYTLIASINPTDVTEDKTLTWTSSNPDIVSVDSNGTITILQEGIATITVSSENGIKASAEITVDNSLVPTKILGDMDHDFKITLKDVVALLKKYLGVETDESDDGDMNVDGRITLTDIIILLKIYLGIY